ncbi:MAG: citrate/2-methylcitrate synthase [Fimbriimonadaceae bacterium]
MSATAYPNYSPGLEGVIGGITTISEIDSDRSSLVYRGYDVHDLAQNGTFEETCYLLLYGKLPNREELNGFLDTLRRVRQLPAEVVVALRLTPKHLHPMDQLKVAYTMLAGFDPNYGHEDHGSNVRKAMRIIATAPAMVAAGHRLRHGQEPIEPHPDLATAANFLYMLTGQVPDEETAKIFDSTLTLYAEHGFNASTFACRVTVSTLSDLYSGIVSGIGTLKGPLHGGANEEAMRMLLEIGTPANAESWVREALATKKKVMGFGHREYKKGDSRALWLGPVAKDLGIKRGNPTWGKIADILERVMLEEKGLYPNVDFPAAYLYYLLGIPIELYTPIFVVARVSGWSAHAIEQLDNNRLIRPTVIYEGPKHRPWVPIDERVD